MTLRNPIMTLPSLIAIGGRKGSGKTVLVKDLQKRGYQRVSMADPLKSYLAQLYNWELASLYDEAGKEEMLSQPVQWNAEAAKRLAEIAHLDTSAKPLRTEPVTFFRRREAMQYVGTDVLHEYQHDFHIQRLLERIVPGSQYAIDDIRFPNELEMVEQAGHLPVYIVRPYHWHDISLHASETALRRGLFAHVLLNHCSENHLLRRWHAFLECISPKNTGRPETTASRRREKRDVLYHFYDWDGCRKFALYNTPEAAFWGGVLASTATVIDLPDGDGKIRRTAVKITHHNGPLVHALRRYLGTRNHVIHHSADTSYCTLRINSPWVQDDLKYWGLDRGPCCERKPPPLSEPAASHWAAGILTATGKPTTVNGLPRWEIGASDTIAKWFDQRWPDERSHQVRYSCDNDVFTHYNRPFGNGAVIPDHVATWPKECPRPRTD